MKFEKGDIVIFKQEHRDENDDLKYFLLEEPDGGKAKVSTLDTSLEYPSIEVVKKGLTDLRRSFF